jgi:hypothetical protein
MRTDIARRISGTRELDRPRPSLGSYGFERDGHSFVPADLPAGDVLRDGGQLDHAPKIQREDGFIKVGLFFTCVLIVCCG